jgi:hypothetical protein
MRVAQPIVLSEETRRKLERQSRGVPWQARVVLRSRIVLLAAEGLQNKQIASNSECCPAHGGAVAGPVYRAWHRRPFEGCAPAGRTPSIPERR